MTSSENLYNLMQEILSRFINHVPGTDSRKANTGKTAVGNPSLTPQQALVIAGILGNVLMVDSVLVDRNQNVEIVLTGTLKRKTQMDRLLDQIGSMPFDEVVRAFVERLM